MLLSMSWISPLIKMGWDEPLRRDHIWNMIEADTAGSVVFEYDQQKKGSLLYRIIKVNTKYFLLQYCLAFFLTILVFAGPFFMYTVVSAIGKGARGWDLLGYIVSLFL